MKTINTKLLIFLFLFIYTAELFSQELERPFILVKSSDRNQILDKIKTKPWANKIHTTLKSNTDKQVDKFYKFAF